MDQFIIKLTKLKKSYSCNLHLQLAIRNDDELNKLLASVTIAQGGVLPKKSDKTAKKITDLTF